MSQFFCKECGSNIVQHQGSGEWICRQMFCKFFMEPHPAPFDFEAFDKRAQDRERERVEASRAAQARVTERMVEWDRNPEAIFSFIAEAGIEKSAE